MKLGRFTSSGHALTAKKCTKQHDVRTKLLFCQSKPIAFLLFSLPPPLLSSLLSLPSANSLPDCQKPAFLMFGLKFIFSLGSMPRTPSNSTPTKCQKNKTYKSNVSLRKSNVHFHNKKMECLLPLTELKLSPRDYYSSFNLLLQVTFA